MAEQIPERPRSPGPAWSADRVPVRPARRVKIAAAARRRLLELAGEIRAAEPRIDDIAPFGAAVRQGLGPGPAVIFGDASEIRLLATADRAHFDYRLAWLAGPGDVAVIGGSASPGFEAYQRSLLGVPGLSYLHVPTDEGRVRRPSPVACLKDPRAFARLRAACRGVRDLTLLAHITTGTIWGLAARLASDTGATVHVAGPPPLLSRRVNDKLWFGDVVARLLGPGARPEKRAAHSFSALTRAVRELGRRFDRLVLKVPDSAGSAGNFPLPAQALRQRPAAAVHAGLRARLAAFAGQPPWPLAVEVWEADVLASPSVQVWIPLSGDGEPIIEGLYEQLLAGNEQAFVGAVPAALPRALDRQLSADAMRLAMVFQALGYFGRVSFDAILSGPDLSRARVQWVECNGRWGGVSIPMTLAHRLAAGGPLPDHVIVQEPSPGGTPRPFSEARRLAEATERATGARLALLTPGPYERGSGSHLLALAGSREAAHAAARDFAARLA